jgi:8-oxo-dGTP pyrophosphatase MutT (NUDIX family)
MTDSSTGSSPKPILAAGGIVLGVGRNGGKIAIVRRRRYAGEIALPKGKLRKGESETDAAVREVGEETGYTAKIREFAGTTRYRVGRIPKVVFYFLMGAEEEEGTGVIDEDEIAAIDWMTPAEAVAALTHRDDRELVAALFAIVGGGGRELT